MMDESEPKIELPRPRRPLDPLLEHIDHILPLPMFLTALAFLLIGAAVIHRVGSDPRIHHADAVVGLDTGDLSVESFLPPWWLLGPLVIMWITIASEAVLRFILCTGRTRFRVRLLYLVVICIFPPVRLCGYSYVAPNERMWLPFFGWRNINRQLRKDLESVFGLPMILMALMVVPLLGMEYFWHNSVRSSYGWSLALDIGNSIVWASFALEFIIKLEVADKKIRYCIQNWIDLAIVVLPLIEFLPILRILRLSRVVRLQQVTRIGRIYRLRGMLMKAWRAILILEVFHRLFGNVKLRRLTRLRELVNAMEEELEHMKLEIKELEAELGELAKEDNDEEKVVHKLARVVVYIPPKESEIASGISEEKKQS